MRSCRAVGRQRLRRLCECRRRETQDYDDSKEQTPHHKGAFRGRVSRRVGARASTTMHPHPDSRIVALRHGRIRANSLPEPLVTVSALQVRLLVGAGRPITTARSCSRTHPCRSRTARCHVRPVELLDHTVTVPRGAHNNPFVEWQSTHVSRHISRAHRFVLDLERDICRVQAAVVFGPLRVPREFHFEELVHPFLMPGRVTRSRASTWRRRRYLAVRVVVVVAHL